MDKLLPIQDLPPPQSITIKITKVGQVFSLENAIGNPISGDLLLSYDVYKGSIFFLPSVVGGPEDPLSLNSPNNTPVGTNYYPQFYKQYPLTLQRKAGTSDYQYPPYTHNLTGTACIICYIINEEAPKKPLIVVPVGSFTGLGNLWPGPGAGTVNHADWEILPFTNDSVNDMNYTGSTVSQQNTVCYTLNLVNLILPNLTLKSAIGGLISFYPYVYVEISNVSAASGSTKKGAIYSNNPHAVSATFKMPIDNVPTPVISKYIKLSGPMTQTLKFKPNDNLHFRVFFSDGETFVTLLSDTAPPTIPDPLVQISALLEIERL